jgi:soluble lytic murein transglycosylase-like protein
LFVANPVGNPYHAAMHSLSLTASLVLASFCIHAEAYCFVEAGQRYGVDPVLLQAIAKVESSGKWDAMNRNHQKHTHSVDIGLMQINSRWLQREPLLSLGYTEAHLLNPCTNVMVGAWVLAGNFRTYGINWDAVGAYNASCTALDKAHCTRARNVYAWKVYKAMTAS